MHGRRLQEGGSVVSVWALPWGPPWKNRHFLQETEPLAEGGLGSGRVRCDARRDRGTGSVNWRGLELGTGWGRGPPRPGRQPTRDRGGARDPWEAQGGLDEREVERGKALVGLVT